MKDVQASLKLSKPTLAHYSQSAVSFWEGTRDHDVSQNIEALLRGLGGRAGLRILDLGCGPGRDLHDFKARGHHPIGLEGSLPFCEMARAHSGCEVWHQNFLTLDLPDASFDGIFANASLFHVPGTELPRVLCALYATLVDGGALFSSNPRGANKEGWNGDRYGMYHDLEGWSAFMNGAGFTEIDHYYRPKGQPRSLQPWLASTWRKGKALS
jgi:SAM-dependent methyltransferase